MTRRKTAAKRTDADRGNKKAPEHVDVRLSPEHLARIEALRAHCSRPWREATRSDVVRMLIFRGLDAFEAQDAPPKSTRRPRVTR